MKRAFYLGELPGVGEEVALPQESLHKLTTVLKTSPGERFMLYGKGWWAEAEFLGRTARIIAVNRYDVPTPEVHGALAFLKKDKISDAARFASQLLLNGFYVFKSNRSLVEHKGRGWEERIERILLNFSPVPSAPEFSVLSWEDVISFDADLKIIPSVWKGALPLEEALRSRTNVRKILFVIGPEGGFTEEEIEESLKADFVAVSLGAVPLFSEIAFFYTGAVVNEFFRRYFRASRVDI